jgi:zinc transporter 1/2/3
VGSETGSTTFQVSGDDRVPDEIVIRSMEAGCIVHSLILGLALGLETDFNTLVILLTVFSVHQLLEGLALGYLISGIKSSLEKICAIVLTMISMPLGVAIGLLVSAFGDVSSANATAGPITACMSSIAGGLLLYTTLTNFTGEDVKRSDVLADGKLRAAMGLSFLVGLASMTAVSAGEVANGSHVH